MFKIMTILLALWVYTAYASTTYHLVDEFESPTSKTCIYESLAGEGFAITIPWWDVCEPYIFVEE